MTLDPGITRADDLAFADPAQEDQQQGTLDDDSDGILNPHEDGGQAGTVDEPDQGPAVGPAADSDE